MVHHTCLDIRGAIKHARDLKGAITVNSKTLATTKEVRDFLKGQLAIGREVLPVCHCKGFSFITGCPGHQSREEVKRHSDICDLMIYLCDKRGKNKSCEKFCGIDECEMYSEAERLYDQGYPFELGVKKV